ncbi:hypothetical protein LSAT2_018457 [Lamellibrachia satsuma]|nr:hypothetical protein LSAT2_018457 [Lamellibrachia satsuma]
MFQWHKLLFLNRNKRLRSQAEHVDITKAEIRKGRDQYDSFGSYYGDNDINRRQQLSICGQMALRPVLKSKVDELFRQWICDTETEALLWESLKKITRGEHVGSLPATTPRQPSPRIQLSTAASTPPCSPISTDRLGSPRGRSLFGSGKQSGRHGNQNSNSNDLNVGLSGKETLHGTWWLCDRTLDCRARRHCMGHGGCVVERWTVGQGDTAWDMVAV